MVIGKTSSSMSLEELLDKYTEPEILSAVFPQITTLPCKINSPFREDNNPSFSIYLDDNKHVRFKDFGDSDVKGGLFDLLCKYWNCSFNQAFIRILDIMQQHDKTDVILRPKQLKTFTRKESSELTKIQVVVRPWRDYDLEYWNSYGISKKWLQYAEVYPIQYKIVVKKDSPSAKPKKYIFPTPKYSYAYVERKDGKVQLKIYSPFETKYKWCSKMDESVWSLWTKVPQKGDNIIIGSSTKDCLNISCQLHIPAICMQGEGYWPKPQVIEELKRRYKQVIVFFDNDYNSEENPGRKDSIKLSKEFGLPRIEIPKKYEAKDPSDLYKKYGRDKYTEIMNEILEPVLWKSGER